MQDSIIGRRFERWTVVAIADSDSGRRARVMCECECGTKRTVGAQALTSGRSKSCGCWQRDNRVTKHGGCGTPEYAAWNSMCRRCHTPSTKNFYNYGGRGISVCDRWRGNFASFFADMGTRPTAGHSVDRIDNNGNYEPGNVRWATLTEQANNRRGNRRVAIHGETLTLAQWERRTGIGRRTIAYRLNHGWPASAALTTPTGFVRRAVEASRETRKESTK